MTVMTERSGARLDIGDVIGDAFAVIERNLAPFVIAALIMVVAPTFLQTLARLAGPSNIGLSLIATLMTVAAGVMQLILSAGLLYATVQDLSGSRRPPLQEFLGVGSKAFLPLLGLTILVLLAAYLGFFLLIVPGVLVLLRWSVAGAALVAEGRGVMASMGRSAALTKNHRGAIFLLYLIIGVIATVVNLIVFGLMGGMAAAVTLARSLPLGPAGAFVALVVSPLLSAVTNVILSVISASLFHDLKTMREGAASETLAKVFE